MNRMYLKTRSAQTAMEYLLILTVVGVVVLAGMKLLLPKVNKSSDVYFNSVTKVVLGEKPQPINGGWCKVDFPTTNIGNQIMYRTCECPAPAFGGEDCSATEKYKAQEGENFDCIGDTCRSKGSCFPQCEGKSCGPDGCGGSCGTLQSGNICCNGVSIGPGVMCCGDGACDVFAGENHANCAADCPCIPNCSGKSCGPDGCGGSCGNPQNGNACCNGVSIGPGVMCCGDGACDKFAGENNSNCPSDCPCAPNCSGKSCGPDGCGGSCGTPQSGFGCCNGKILSPGEKCCGDGICDVFAGEMTSNCPVDCH